MMEAWNQGSAERFAAPFTENADFIAFEGTHLQGRAEIIAFHQQIFATVVKGSRLVEAAAKFVHFLTPQLAVLHATVRVILPGETAPSPSRDSMQLFVVRKHAGEWRAEAMLNARRLTLERQAFLDDFDALPRSATSGYGPDGLAQAAPSSARRAMIGSRASGCAARATAEGIPLLEASPRWLSRSLYPTLAGLAR